MAWSDAARRAAAAVRRRNKTEMGRLENFVRKQNRDLAMGLGKREAHYSSYMPGGSNYRAPKKVQTITDRKGVKSRWVDISRKR